jgi:hypothetical protein
MLKRRERDSKRLEHASLALSVRCKCLKTQHPLAHGIMHVAWTTVANEGRLLHRLSRVMLNGRRGMRAVSAIVTDMMEQEHAKGRPCETGYFQVVSDIHLMNVLSILVRAHGSEV